MLLRGQQEHISYDHLGVRDVKALRKWFRRLLRSSYEGRETENGSSQPASQPRRAKNTMMPRHGVGNDARQKTIVERLSALGRDKTDHPGPE